jgi:uncharacterized alkaline shock family protein YloU
MVMIDPKKKLDPTKVDIKELEVPETLFVRDIENRVFQSIVLQCLAKIQDISLTEGNFIDSIFGRAAVEGVKGIQAEQDNKNRSVRIRVEVNIAYGVSIPEKADEIQSKVAEEITRLTGLHVSCVHVVFKNLITPEPPTSSSSPKTSQGSEPRLLADPIVDEYTEEFR